MTARGRGQKRCRPVYARFSGALVGGRGSVPFPYLRWPARIGAGGGAVRRIAPAARAARRRSSGSGLSTSTGASKRAAGRRAGTGARGRARRAPPYSGSPATGWPIACEVDADLVGAAGLEPHAQQRRLRQRLARSRSACAPRAARRCRSTCRVRWRRSRPIGASIVPLRAGGRPCDEREVLAGDLAPLELLLQAPVGLVRVARRPAGPRCRGPGGGRCPPALVLAARGAAGQRLRERAVAVALGRDGRRRPAGLSTMSRCSSS